MCCSEFLLYNIMYYVTSQFWLQVHIIACFVTINPKPAKEFLVCFNFPSASMSLKDGENVVWVSNSLDLDETPSYSASHPDQAVCIWHLGLALKAKG